jgi:hypothetical protein
MPKNLSGIKIEQWGPITDVEFEFKTRSTSDEILAILMRQIDSHLMIGTLKSMLIIKMNTD